jgi:hypothetical protein
LVGLDAKLCRACRGGGLGYNDGLLAIVVVVLAGLALGCLVVGFVVVVVSPFSFRPNRCCWGVVVAGLLRLGPVVLLLLFRG